MSSNKTIVRVASSFFKKEELLLYISGFAQYREGRFACWDEFAFTVDELELCDAVVVFNNPSGIIRTICDPAKLIAIMMEPGIRTEHPWMFSGLEQYAIVYSPVENSPNTIVSHGFLGWHLPQNWQSLKKLSIPKKQHDISCIASNLMQLSGHRLRTRFIEHLKNAIPDIHFYGKGSNYIEDKSTALLPYRYSIAIENTHKPHYFTEKINDCFLTWTVPLYFGCTNIGDYFPERSFINLDINNPEKAIQQIKDIVANDQWDQRQQALQEARELVLNKYQPLAGAGTALRQTGNTGRKKEITIKPVPATLRKKISILFNKFR